MREEALAPKLYGPMNFRTLYSVGGRRFRFQGGVDAPGLKKQLFWLSNRFGASFSVDALLKRARRIVAAEGNSTAQFARLLRAQTGVAATDTVLKYNGLQFSVEEAARRLSEVFSGTGGRS